MLGYVRIFADELKIKDYETYRSYYCGICHDIKYSSGQVSRISLNYDMTFAAILLTSLYDDSSTKCEYRRCIFHAAKKKRCFRNIYTQYAADMCVLLTYHNLEDDWIDEKKKSSYVFAGALKKHCKKIALKYPRQNKAVVDYLDKLHVIENAKAESLDEAANATGEMLGELLNYHEDDIWSGGLKRLGFFLGKFIYLMDAYEDVEKDRESGSYNPMIKLSGESNFKEKSREILMMVAAEAARSFERLPIVENVDILRNILYCGIWTRFGIVNSEENNNKKKKRKCMGFDDDVRTRA